MRTKVVVSLIVLSCIMAGSFAAVAQDSQKGGLININTATQDELETLPGIGPKLAQLIIAGRPYTTIEGLIDVKGIGEKKLAAIKNLVTVGEGTKRETQGKEGQGQGQEQEQEDVNLVNLNSASKEELAALPGLSDKVAQAIIDGRPYENVEDLLNVKGIGEKTLEKIRNLVTVAEGKVDINSATKEALAALPGLSDKVAQAIIDNRPYENVEDLLNVKGIGQKTLEKIQDLVEVKPVEENK